MRYVLAHFAFQFIKLANPLWFYFYYKIIHFQSENTGKKVILPPNKSKQGSFLFPSCDWLYFFQSRRVSYKKTRAQVLTTSSIECLEYLVDLRYL